MVDVIKYGPEVIKELGDLDRISNQIKDRQNDGVVVVTVGLNNTTDNILDALYFKNHKKAEQVFGSYIPLIRQIDDKNLNKIFDLTCIDFNTQINSKYKNTERLIASGPELTAHMLNVYLHNYNIPSIVIDVGNSNFPLRLKEDKSIEIDMKTSREIAQNIKKANVTIIPGYVGIRDGVVRTLGRGGGDIAAFVCAYAFGAKNVWIVAEDSITTAPIKNAKVVDEIDLEEARAAGFFGARLRTYRSIEPLRTFFNEYNNSQVFITGKDMKSRKTRINPNAKQCTIRFIASRHIDRYGIEGDWRGLFNMLYKNPTIDHFYFGGMPGEGGIAVSERGRELANDIIKQAEKKGEIKVTYHDNVAYIGVVGSGMSGKEGILNRVYNSLKGIKIQRGYDPDVSKPNSRYIGIMVDPKDEERALTSLHREFFGKCWI